MVGQPTFALFTHKVGWGCSDFYSEWCVWGEGSWAPPSFPPLPFSLACITSDIFPSSPAHFWYWRYLQWNTRKWGGISSPQLCLLKFQEWKEEAMEEQKGGGVQHTVHAEPGTIANGKTLHRKGKWPTAMLSWHRSWLELTGGGEELSYMKRKPVISPEPTYIYMMGCVKVERANGAGLGSLKPCLESCLE